MRLRWLVLTMLFFHCVGLAAEPTGSSKAFIPGQISDYQAVRRFQEKLGVKDGLLPEEGAPKAEMLLALA
jgi:hypothetical protein